MINSKIILDHKTDEEGKFKNSIPPNDYTQKTQQKAMLSFSGNFQTVCVSLIDIVHSTKITSMLSELELSQFYSFFLNTMAAVIKKHNGIIVKNIGDALLYYFPVTDSIEKCIDQSLQCNIAILRERKNLNKVLSDANLPTIRYRVSSDFGRVIVATSMISLIDDIFGSAVNMCAKINSMGKPNRIVIGNDLYIYAKSLQQYKFVESESKRLDDFKTCYPIYLVL